MEEPLKLVPQTTKSKQDIGDILQDAIDRLPNMKVAALVWAEEDGRILTSWAGGSTLEVAGLATVLASSVMLRMESDEDG